MVSRWGMPIMNNIAVNSWYSSSSRKLFAWLICIQRSHNKHKQHIGVINTSYKFFELEQCYLSLKAAEF